MPAMTRTDEPRHFQFPPGSRVGIIAGGGAFPGVVARSLAARRLEPFLLIVEGETLPEAGLEQYSHETLALEKVGSLVGLLRRHGVTHVMLAGEIKRRPRLSAIRITPGLLAIVPSLVAALARGDDGLLRIVVRGLEARGFTVVGAHQVVPELLAVAGTWTKAAPDKSDWRDIAAARAAAEAIGALDIGQGAIAVGGRAVALEGIEGTNGLLERMCELRHHGRLAGKAGGVLVKCAKPGQELRVDLPSVGPTTIELAHAAGLSGIAVEASRSLVIGGPELVARADALGLFALGLPPRSTGDAG